MVSDGKEVAFKLSDSCVLKIVQGDITNWSVDGSSDAIVNPANGRMLGGNGADGGVFNLQASHVIHTVGPIYNAEKNPKKLLESAYKNSLRVAKDNNIQYIAFTAISCGIFRYPLDEAASIAISTVKQFGQDFKEF
ncbi:PREDICTED: uncharacterized protein LOC104782543 [Camelina sativa]|uniref:Uncharacterized protein LOC104782543 n=1 Tax=Camelina sativa TaxID=90675 RepID=A0ABM1RL97_CAMSA|nr:PREDICTED: uncharacterized protein LOC104782543 [Camelina sativa]